MEKIIGVCGIVCSDCPAYVAYKNDDQELRIKSAKEWSEMYGAEIKPEDVNCVGCMVEGGPKIGHCFECEIRACGVKNKVATCADCKDYSCEALDKFLEMVPEAKTTLDDLRK
ncbi:MAG TPA: DUF3795 domain-containing protein [Caldisericia bacterium]|nr:DUF3795 domain-containing protein [Caldisericia bacterium]HPF49368.1 DUF3795 domain-containing protein [Caldisericia bacterium]HPI84444.1 DUF3795 domain-containing protein [Caldisericia bacterium]HPQ93795.1 DUF3795 domain-containing protein [Caldisericia bacterium]HRV75641.1 DUF3795 domain-containing protein [Caldisericia bacterium]